MLEEISIVITQSDFVFNSYMPKDHLRFFFFCLFGVFFCVCVYIHKTQVNDFHFLVFIFLKTFAKKMPIHNYE